MKLNEDDTWHLLDCTAASGSFTKEKFTKKYNHLYFAIPSTQLSYTHWPEDQHWQLLQHPLSLEEFRSQLPLSPEVFSLGMPLYMYLSIKRQLSVWFSFLFMEKLRGIVQGVCKCTVRSHGCFLSCLQQWTIRLHEHQHILPH